MEVLAESYSPVLLSNAEVLEMLGHNVDRRKALESTTNTKKKRRKPSKFAHRDWIEESVYRYLRGTPCVDISDTSKIPEFKSKLTSSKKQLQNKGVSTKVTGFGLTEAESVQMINLMPTEPVEIHLIVEEMQLRLSEDQQGKLLELVASYRKEVKDENAGDTAVEECTDGKPDDENVVGNHIPLKSIKAEVC